MGATLAELAVKLSMTGMKLTPMATTPLSNDDLMLYSISSVAKQVDYSISNVVRLERAGVLPPALRLEGSNRRVYRRSDIETIKSILKDRKTAMEMPT